MKVNDNGTIGTVFKPLSEIEAAINNTSAGGMLLFMIAQDKAERAAKQPILINSHDNPLMD